MKQCCGQDCDTNFCPSCGAKLKDRHPLESLLKDILAKLRRDNQTLTAWRNHKEANTKRWKVNIDKQAVKVMKYQVWADCLQKAIERDLS